MKRRHPFVMALMILLTAVGGRVMALDGVMDLDADQQSRYGVELEELKPCEHRATMPAYGEVLDPEPMLRQWNDFQLAMIKSQGASRDAERARALNAKGRLASDKVLEQAELQLQTSLAQEQLTRSVVEHAWGSGYAELDDSERTTLVEKLMKRQLVLVRLSLQVGGKMPAKPAGAKIYPVGDESRVTVSRKLWSDPKVSLSKAPGYLTLIDPGEENWPIGLAVAGKIEMGARASKGLEVPASAVVYDDGSAWVFQQTAKDEFVQKQVLMVSRLTNGWFVPDGVLNASQPIVTKGAQAMLAQKIQERSGGQNNE